MSFAVRSLTLLVLVALLPVTAHAWDRGTVTTFATLPAGAAHPEGIAVDSRGNVYVGTFAVGGTSSGVGQIFVFSARGKLLRTLDVEGSSTLLLDIAFHPQTRELLVIDFGGQKVLSVNPVNGKSKIFTTIPGGASAGPNVLTFDAAGNVYVSDSFQGVIWRTGPDGGTATAWVSSSLLTTSGVPPFGANGLAFNNAGTALFVANTGSDTVVRIPVDAEGRAGTPAVFANSVNGADGLIVDADDNIWVAANQADEIVVLNSSGRHIAKLGDFGGVDATGRPIGLLFPASLVFSGGSLYVTNLAVDLRLFNPAFSTGDSEWTTAVTRHTISRMPATLPPVPGLR
jgi:sugar lactone lactonase YvrE